MSPTSEMVPAVPLSAPDAFDHHPREAQTSGINGTGIWASWKRNFTSPILALLDLFDNAMDATMGTTNSDAAAGRGKSGKIHVYGDVNPNDKTEQTGICILNNCRRRIPPLKHVLEVFKSQKTSIQIGENGVGVKQACASLSNLSFVLTRNKLELGLGLIARDLQEKEKVVLPSFTFVCETLALQAKLEQLVDAYPDDLGKCVQQYGENDMEQGIKRLVRQYERMCIPNTWHEEDFVFMVVIHDGVHQNGDSTGPAQLIEAFAEELPKNYLHVPLEFEVRVQSKPIIFQYWERRLVELSKFPIWIDPENSWKTAHDWELPEGSYRVNLYLGFDPYRASREDGDTKASLSIYSRKSGRLIKYTKDARALLKLDSGGTTFAQGLTIILDDVEGRLPLTPTKQDLAFGHEATGDIHEENLYAWIGAFTNLYYKKILDIYIQKQALRLEVESRLGAVQANATRRIHKTLSCGDFSTLQELAFRQVKNATIRCTNKNRCKIHHGTDTLIKINRHPHRQQVAGAPVTKKRRLAELIPATERFHSPIKQPAASARTISNDDSFMSLSQSPTPRVVRSIDLSQDTTGSEEEDPKMPAMASRGKTATHVEVQRLKAKLAEKETENSKLTAKFRSLGQHYDSKIKVLKENHQEKQQRFAAKCAELQEQTTQMQATIDRLRDQRNLANKYVRQVENTNETLRKMAKQYEEQAPESQYR